MMGRQTADQRQLFYQFNLDERVPAGHLLRRFDVFVVRAQADPHHDLAAYYSHTGRPSIDPELMIRMLIVGYCYGIRSERRLCEEVALNLAYRWFCRLDLNDEVPDHSTFSKSRHGRFRESALSCRVFERIVGLCIETGLVGGEGFAVDASVMEADASRYHGVAPDEIDWTRVEKPSRAVREYPEILGAAPFRPDLSLSCWHPGLRDLPAESQVLPEYAPAQGHARCQRGSPRRCQGPGRDEFVRAVMGRAQEGRDALRPSQDPSSLRTHEIARSIGSARQIPPRRHRPEPQDHGSAAYPSTNSHAVGLAADRPKAGSSNQKKTVKPDPLTPSGSRGRRTSCSLSFSTASTQLGSAQE